MTKYSLTRAFIGHVMKTDHVIVIQLIPKEITPQIQGQPQIGIHQESFDLCSVVPIGDCKTRPGNLNRHEQLIKPHASSCQTTTANTAATRPPTSRV